MIKKKVAPNKTRRELLAKHTYRKKDCSLNRQFLRYLVILPRPQFHQRDKVNFSCSAQRCFIGRIVSLLGEPRNLELRADIGGNIRLPKKHLEQENLLYTRRSLIICGK